MSEHQMPLLKISNLTKDFGGLRAVSDLSFDVNQGTIMGLIGPNGAGKSTTFNLISGFLPSTSGRIIYEGGAISGLSSEKIAKLGIIRTFQANSVFSEMSVLMNVMLGFHIHSKIGFLGAFFNSKYTRKREAELSIQALEILASVGLDVMASKSARSLSHGHQRALEIAIALAAQPKLLLLDEPVSGMSKDETAMMTQTMERLRNEGVTVLLVEHDMKMVMRACDRIVVMNFGEKIAEGTPQEIANNEQVIEAYLGTGEE